jgi:dihydroorotase
LHPRAKASSVAAMTAEAAASHTGAPFDLLVRGGTCATPAGLVRADVGVRGGRIVAVGDLAAHAAAEVFDARGLHVLPGVIDSQVHFREPGLEHKEDLATGSASACLGGVTTILEMPNTNPSTTTAEALADKVARAEGRVRANVGFFVGAADENADDLARLEVLPGAAGIKIFMGSSTGSLLVESESVLARALRSGRRRVAIHAEDEARLRERRPLAEGSGGDPSLHPVWRDADSARLATERLLRVAREARRRVHVLHVTTADEMAILADHKDLATVEVTPQHLTLAAPECYARLGTFAQMNPPIRGEEHRAALWRALESGVVDVIGSDHAPHTREEKAKTYPASPSGMPGVQTLLPLMLDHVHAGRLSLLRLVDLVCHGPARLYGIARKGRLAVGFDADLTLVDLERRVTLTHAMMASRCGWTPFDGLTVTGFPVATVLAGALAMREGELLGAPRGGVVRFEECL